MKPHKGWHSRGYLPHFDAGEIVQSVTFHLGDALPKSIIKKWKLKLEQEPDEEAKIELQYRIEKYLDKGYGNCHLRNENVARIVERSLLHFDRERYKLISWVIMPNHLHLLIKPQEDYSLSGIVHSIKPFSAQQANKILNIRGKFWQEDYFDRYIRNFEHFESTLKYIENNPVKAGLCKKSGDWKYGSARR